MNSASGSGAFEHDSSCIYGKYKVKMFLFNFPSTLTEDLDLRKILRIN